MHYRILPTEQLAGHYKRTSRYKQNFTFHRHMQKHCTEYYEPSSVRLFIKAVGV
jgi:hypothetical protein